MSLNDEARAFLDRHAVAHLATAGADGAPHVVPLCYARLGDALYFVADDKPKRHGPRGLRRLANIAENPRVALVVDDYDDAWQRLAYLLVHADAAAVTDAAEYAAALAALRARYAPYRRMPLGVATHPMVRLQPRRWHLWRIDEGRLR
ncbi:MAG: TIGR03668 family PPOX class F420-dependent oxidoreductase [Deltaproteobacteria bacterium]|nr:TIGR03668 family PPOX class F420-dependent oxidoreductase [Deltaproteobacteria bacterium]